MITAGAPTATVPTAARQAVVAAVVVSGGSGASSIWYVYRKRGR